MSHFTPKPQPWQATRGYEKIDAYPVPAIPVINERWIPSYVPDEMLTTPLTFPNLVTGYNQIPFHPAAEHCTLDEWNEHLRCLEKNVKKCLDESKPVRENLENLVRQRKSKLKDNAEAMPDVGDINSRIVELSSNLEKTIRACTKMQDCKRQLQSLMKGIEGPLQISQECLYHREQKNGTELVDDEVEQLLVKETQVFCQGISKLKECMKCCENQLLEGRRYQYDLETCIKKAQWAVCVEKTKAAVDKLLESNTWTKKAECLCSKSCSVIAHMDHNRNEANKSIKEIKKSVSKIWDETNKAFAKRRAEIEVARSEIECSIAKLKNEIINVEKNLKYLETNSKDKEIHGDLQRGKDQLESLLRTKKALDCELSSKMKSLFIDTHGCMSMRKSFPISITTDH